MIQENSLYVENGIHTMRRMPDNYVDLVLTSPPYDDLRTYKGYKFDFKDMARGISRILAWGGVLVWVVGDEVKNGSETGTAFRQALYFKDICGLNLHDTMIYEKNSPGLPDNVRYLQCFEYMFVFSKGKPKTVNFLEDRKNRFVERWGTGRKVREKDGNFTERQPKEYKEYGRRFNIWRYNTGGGYSTTDEIAFKHPAIFPEHLAGDHIMTWTNPGDLVYDPMGGSGTTAKMSHLLKRRWIMSEMSRHYAEDIIQPRLAQHLPVNLLF